MINCVLVDDEPLALQLMESFIGKVPFLKVAASFEEPLLALDYLNTHTVDLLFLDVSMPDISGIHFFKSLAKKPYVILTTAHGEFALDGFEINALDFLLKPIAFERFLVSVNRAKTFFEEKPKENEEKEFFFINAAHKVHKIFYRDIAYLESIKDYTKIFFTTNEPPLMVLHNLKYFEGFLPAARFVRIHRSYIVPLAGLSTISRRHVTIGKTDLPVSDSYRTKLFELIGSHPHASPADATNDEEPE